jgi:tetratricopeptide (TPR) repeat protein
MAGRSEAEALLALVDSDPHAVLGADALMAELEGSSDPIPLAIALRARALAHAHLEKLDQAVATIEKAMEHAAGDEGVMGGVEMTAGALMVWTGRTDRGLSLLRSAATRPSTGSEAGIQFGASLYRLGRYTEALTVLENARASLSPDEVGWWSRLETNLGLTLAALGRTHDAREAITRSIEIDQKAGHAQGVANGYQNLGWVAAVAGDLPAAFGYYEEAAARLAIPGSAELWRDRAEALLSAGFVDEAVAATRAASTALARSGHATAASEAKLKLAQATLLKGDWTAAEEAAQQAAEQFESQGRPGWAAYAESLALSARAIHAPVEPEPLLELAQRLEGHGFASAAQQTLVRAVTAAVERGRALEVVELADHLVQTSLRPQVVAAAWLARAQLHRALGSPRRALGSASRGMAAVEELSAALGGSEARAHAARNLDDLALLALQLTRSTGHPRKVFDWIERTRAGSLRLPRIRTSGDEGTAALVSELRSLERSALGLPPGRPLDDLFRQRSRLEIRIRHRARALRGEGAHARPIRAAEVLADLSADEAILALAHADGELIGVLLHRNRAREFAVSSDRDLYAAQQRLLRSLGRSARRPSPARAAALEADLAAFPLDLARLPQSIEAVVVVPPPDLYGLPWSLLPGLASRTVAVAPSATAALSIANSPPTSVAAVAGTGLRHAEGEAARVAAVYPQSQVLAGGATAEDALEALEGVDVGHLACHGTFRIDSPLFSSLELAGGALYLHELERLRRPPRVMVLSSCDLGDSAVVSGGETLGPVTAMIAAGVRTVIASPVLVPDDELVGEVLTAFHRGIREGISPARSLADAKGRLDPTHPMALVLGAVQCHGRW